MFFFLCGSFDPKYSNNKTCILLSRLHVLENSRNKFNFTDFL